MWGKVGLGTLGLEICTIPPIFREKGAADDVIKVFRGYFGDCC